MRADIAAYDVVYDAPQATAKRRREPKATSVYHAHLIDHEFVLIGIVTLFFLAKYAAATSTHGHQQRPLAAQREQRQQGLRRCCLRAPQSRSRRDCGKFYFVKTLIKFNFFLFFSL